MTGIETDHLSEAEFLAWAARPRRRRRVTRRPSYRAAVFWIAHNDESGAGHDLLMIAGYISTCLVADLFGCATELVAEDVLRERRRAGLPVGR